MPGVLEIMALDSEAEEKAARRQRELDLQVTARIDCTWGIHFGGSTCKKGLHGGYGTCPDRTDSSGMMAFILLP